MGSPSNPRRSMGDSPTNPRRSTSAAGDDTPNIKVCVRVRPFIKEEFLRDGGCPELCVSMPTNRQVELTREQQQNTRASIREEEATRTFEFDRSYWSHCEDDANFATQALVFQELGETLLEHSISGFNNCIFAYGQTGSGKSFSVLGSKDEEGRGLLPRIVQGLFEHFSDLPEGTSCKCLVSFIEIYNEQIRDLLTPSHCRKSLAKTEQKLDVRTHPVLGIIMPGLTEAAAGSCKEVLDLINYGTTIRTVGATAMNQNSSRSHCIFTFKTTVSSRGQARMSQTHLVDLAGSERNKRTGATGDRLKEGAAINKSLSTLARVISALASEDGLPPFRDAKLTYILKESLCGNSKTVMMAAISPSIADYDETLSTLKFAQSVKKVQTHAVINEANDGSIEQQLRNELQKLQEQLQQYEIEKGVDREELADARKRLQEQEDLCIRYGDWDNALAAERRRQVQRRAVTQADLAHLQERFLEMHRESEMARRLSKEVAESSNSSEDWDGQASSDSSDSEPPMLLCMSSEGSGHGVGLPRRLSVEQREQLSQGAFVATQSTTDELATDLKQLMVDASQAEAVATSLNPLGASPVRLLPMVAVDGSGSRRASTVVKVVSSCGYGDLLEPSSLDDAEDTLEWLTQPQLHERLQWLRQQAGVTDDVERQRVGQEGAWAACQRAVQGAPGVDADVARLAAELAEARLRHSEELAEMRRELAEARRQLQSRSEELQTTQRELAFSERARRELELAETARRELEHGDLTVFQPPPRVEITASRPGDAAAEIAASFRNALGALDQAQAALKGNPSRMMRRPA